MGNVKLFRISKSFSDRESPIVSDVSLAIEDGELVVFLGPSGCGKTTLLRMIAGLDHPDSGEIAFDGESVLRLEPKDRDIAFVFQQYALYPHLTVEENLRYPLKVSNLTRSARQERVEWAAELVGIGELLSRRPVELSGGEQQRVAVARAIVRRPTLFLLDEPLSNLDAQTRAKLRSELRALQQSIRTTTIMVTHDQADAMAIADRIVVVAGGVVQQFGTPDEIYERPANRFVAEFLGSPAMNLLPAVVDTASLLVDGMWRLPASTDSSLPRAVIVGVRPEGIELSGTEATFGIPGRVHIVEALGSEVIVHVVCAASTLRVRCGRRYRPAIGSEVFVRVDPEMIHLFDPRTGDAIN